MSPQGTTKAFVMKQGKAKRSVQCYFCKKEHFADQCHEVKDNKRRADILTNAKRCLNCLKIGHTVATCYSKRRCKHCNGKHHPAVCSAPVETENQPTIENPITSQWLKGGRMFCCKPRRRMHLEKTKARRYQSTFFLTVEVN